MLSSFVHFVNLLI